MNKLKALLKKIIKKPKPEYLNHAAFWIQDVSFKSINDRFTFFEELCRNQNVLHLGCTDWPIFDPSYNLHIKLDKVAKSIHGLDIDEDGIENLKKYVNQPYFTNTSQVKDNEYDICIVPETIEHVANVADFLKGLNQVNAKTFYITAPNCFSKVHMSRNHYSEDRIKEIVHPDHNCWYSPFTLKNVIQKYSNIKVEEVFLLNDDTMVCCKGVLQIP